MSYILSAILDFISPRACRLCGKRLGVADKEICGVCNWHLPRTNFIDNPYDNTMSRLFWGRFEVERSAALYYYQSHGNPSKLIYDLKYHGKKDIGEWLGHLVAEEFKVKDFFEDIDAIIPVPITWKRKYSRGYNQSESIARGVNTVTGIPVLRKALKRTRFAESQTQVKPSERFKNVEGAFRLEDKDKISGKHILIVDDVVTTGSTISSCAKELLKAGNVKISVLTIAITKM